MLSSMQRGGCLKTGFVYLVIFWIFCHHCIIIPPSVYAFCWKIIAAFLCTNMDWFRGSITMESI